MSAENKNLRHAWANSTGWHSENLDGDPNSALGQDTDTGYDPTMVLFNGTLQALYYDKTNGNLRHAWSDANGWHCETLDGDTNSLMGNNEDLGGMPTAVSLGGTSLNVFAKDMKWGGLRHYWTDTNGWHSELFDGYGGSPAGRLNYSIGDDPTVTNYNGTLQLFYYDNTAGNLRHAIPQ